ncbi:hypothetical protein DQ384_26215 [Sphaerisporangium album]|uniref:Uncharacterized protein n=1 Tax=Sphaerisporangium album TaxID=509200 RepID=A0A367FBZ4_9ACTN|nr:hypothetical protein [Sphaerisporangium album]RCG27217.1 hypothetical protein DQ384_26215 [Sphaerisporangium album]
MGNSFGVVIFAIAAVVGAAISVWWILRAGAKTVRVLDDPAQRRSARITTYVAVAVVLTVVVGMFAAVLITWPTR